MGRLFYAQALGSVVPVSSTQVAEMVKLLDLMEISGAVRIADGAAHALDHRRLALGLEQEPGLADAPLAGKLRNALGEVREARGSWRCHGRCVPGPRRWRRGPCGDHAASLGHSPEGYSPAPPEVSAQRRGHALRLGCRARDVQDRRPRASGCPGQNGHSSK